jgi:hypothetical protein
MTLLLSCSLDICLHGQLFAPKEVRPDFCTLQSSVPWSLNMTAFFNHPIQTANDFVPELLAKSLLLLPGGTFLRGSAHQRCLHDKQTFCPLRQVVGEVNEPLSCCVCAWLQQLPFLCHARIRIKGCRASTDQLEQHNSIHQHLPRYHQLCPAKL